jgi:hypothetical protein
VSTLTPPRAKVAVRDLIDANTNIAFQAREYRIPGIQALKSQKTSSNPKPKSPNPKKANRTQNFPTQKLL